MPGSPLIHDEAFPRRDREGGLLPCDGQALLFEGVFEPCYERLRDGLAWQEEQITLFGRTHAVPRLIVYHGDYTYQYAGVEHPPSPLPDLLQKLKNTAQTASGFVFNSVLCNFYRHGQDSMGYHRDNEPGMDTRCIASASFGATRRFKMRHRRTRETIDIDLADGSLLLMLDCQEYWEHALPKTRKPVAGRINLTFRWIEAGS